MKKLLVLSAAALMMAACSESPTAPAGARKTPSGAKFDEEFTCKSGYVVAYDEDGNPYCAPLTDGGDNGLRAGPGFQPSVLAPTRPKA
ncbi:MAG: hypothetical protein ABJF01_07600 [bacterium]